MDSRPPPLDLSGTEGGLQPLVPPFPPPPLGTPLRTPSECSAPTPDFNGPSKSFNERLQTIHSKMDLLSRIPMAPVVPTPTGAEPAQSFEERLNRFKQKKKPPTSVGSPPAVAPVHLDRRHGRGGEGRAADDQHPARLLVDLKTNIPPPNLSKPPPTLLVSPTVAPEHPPAAATSSLRPPHVQPPSGSLQPNPTTPSNLSAQFKPPGFQAGGFEVGGHEPADGDHALDAQVRFEHSRRAEGNAAGRLGGRSAKEEDQRKLFQSIRVPKKQPGTSTAEVFSFSSPLSRGQPAAPQPPTTAAVHTPTSAHPHPLRKVSEKPALKTTPSAGSIGKSPSIATPTTNGPTASTAEKIAKNREERERANEKGEAAGREERHLTAFMEKQRRQSNAEIEQTMEKVREKAARKFPADREQREKYVREKMDRFKQHQAQRLRLLEEEKRKKIEQKSVSESSDESEDNSSEILAECGLRNIDLEMQRILFEEAKTGQLNLSMYERVKRKRANTVQSEEHKKQALDLLREKSDKKKKPKRVQMSSSEDSDGHSTTTKVKSSSGARSGSDGDSDVGETSDDGGGSTDAAKRKESSKKAAAKAELRRKAEKAVAKAKKAEKAAQKLSGKKSRKNTAGSTEDSETDRSKPSKSSKKPHHASSGDESDDTTPSVVKKLHKNFAHFTQHETEDSEDDEAAKRRKKRKAKKMSALLGDDDFCANSDDDSSSLPAAPKRSTESGKSDGLQEPDRPTEPTASRKSESVEPKKPKKSKEHRESKQPLKEKAEPRKSAESNEAEPQKKKPKMSVKQEPLEPADPTAESKKRRRSTDEEGASIKRSKSMLGEEGVKSERLSSPLHVHTAPATLEAPAKKSPAPRGLLNFVSQNCQSRDETPIISPLANRFGAVGQEKECPHRRLSSRSRRRRGLEEKPPSAASSPLLPDDSARPNEDLPLDEDDDDEMDYESLLLSELNREDTPKLDEPPPVAAEETFPPQCSQETEDAVESITALMADRNARSEDEEEDGFPMATITHPPISRSSSHGTSGTADLPAAAVASPPKSEQTAVAPPPTTASPPPPAAELPPSSLPMEVPSASTASGRISPISSVVESIARGAPLPPEPLEEPAVPARSTAARFDGRSPDRLGSRLPTAERGLVDRPPADAAALSIVRRLPQYAAQLPCATGQQSPPTASLKPTTTTVQAPAPPPAVEKKAEIPAIYQQQLLAQRGQMGGQRELMTAAEMFQRQAAIQQQQQLPTTSADVSALLAMQQRSRAGSASGPPTSVQRKSGAPAAPPVTTSTPNVVQPPAPTIPAGVAQQPPQMLAGMPAVTPTSDRLANLLTSLSTNLGQPMNPALLQQIITNTDLAAQYPELAQIAAHPEAVEYLAHHFRSVQLQQEQQQMLQLQQREQQHVQAQQRLNEDAAALANLMNMAGPNASPELLRMFALQQHDIQRRQHEEAQRQQQLLQQRQSAEQQRQLQQQEEMKRLVQLDAFRKSQFFPLMHPQQQAALPPNASIAAAMPSVLPTVPPVLPQTSTAASIPRFPPNAHAPRGAKSIPLGRGPLSRLLAGKPRVEVERERASRCTTCAAIRASSRRPPTSWPLRQDDGLPTIRITQRMRLQNPHLVTVCNKMNNEDEFVALICFPCGEDAEQVSQQTTKMTSTFINYLTSKMAAGVVTRAPHAPHPSCVAHVFPPCEFAVQQLQRLAPEIFEEIDKSRSTYLFVVVTRSDGRPIGDDHVDEAKLSVVDTTDPSKFTS
ncbi:SPOC domain-containing protein [Aphelenchoides fujianensis]|nr:SPOC domain-containing protein [Aphelenchoides fujianensis]